jgi:hypothetical protein
VENQVRFTAANALDLVRPYDVIVDASDNVATRYVVNDACVVAGKVSPVSLCSRFPASSCVRLFILKVMPLGRVGNARLAMARHASCDWSWRLSECASYRGRNRKFLPFCALHHFQSLELPNFTIRRSSRSDLQELVLTLSTCFQNPS